MHSSEEKANILRAGLLVTAFALMLYGRGVFLPFVNIGYDLSVIGAVLVLVGIFLVVDVVRWNKMKYPIRYEEQ